MLRRVNEKAIAGMYHSNPVYQCIFKELAAMPRQDETIIEELETRLIKKKEPVSRRELVTFFKMLHDFGAGEWIVGRKGHSSRFRWEVDSINIATMDLAYPPAKPATIAPPPIGPMEPSLAPLVLISHRYQLRQDLVVTLQLPSDITSAEAQRLTQFILSLPFHVQATV